MSAAEQRYLTELDWHKLQPPEINQRPAPLPLARGEDWPHYELAELDDGRKVIAPVYSVPTRIRGRVLCAEFDRAPELSDHVLHVGLAMAGPASWPLLWRLDPSQIVYENEFRFLVTPGWFTTYNYGDAIGAGMARLRQNFHKSERLHVHLVAAWQEDNERLQLLSRGSVVEIYGPVCALVAHGDGEPEILFSEVDPPECWCIHPLAIKSV